MKIRYIIFICLIYMLPIASLARDIDLDNIYIKSNSSNYSKLLEKKMEAYEVTNSRFVDRSVIFADWLNGYEIIYIKEFPETNIIYSYHRDNQQRTEISRINGTITAAKISNGRYLFLKRLIAKDTIIPKGETFLLNINSKKFKQIATFYPFIDFSISPAGNSILYEDNKGIIELFPESNIKRLIINKKTYADVAKSESPTIAYISPNRTKAIIVHGGGGSYKSKIISDKKSWKLDEITSATEVYWIDNQLIIYRTGFPGNFSVCLYDTNTHKKTRLLLNSLNTNIYYSKYPRIISYLKNQIINIYDIRQNYFLNTGLEGEDICFSPDGNRFSSLLLKKLFITNINILKRKKPEIKKVSNDILHIYTKLLQSKESWSNEYTKTYLMKKIAVYKEIVK